MSNKTNTLMDTKTMPGTLSHALLALNVRWQEFINAIKRQLSNELAP